jgi:hypothetical protein
MRKRIEELFGEAKEFMGLRTAKFRRLRFIREQVLMTATAQNIKRMVKLLTKKGPQREALAAQQQRIPLFIECLLTLLMWGSQNLKRIQFADRRCFVRT